MGDELGYINVVEQVIKITADPFKQRYCLVWSVL